jgi:phthiodiolone/phenolphthiodiolone dimycocerosates ketoreductase
MSILPAVEFLVVTAKSRASVDEALHSPILKSLSLTASEFSGSQDLVPHAFDEQTALA